MERLTGMTQESLGERSVPTAPRTSPSAAAEPLRHRFGRRS